MFVDHYGEGVHSRGGLPGEMNLFLLYMIKDPILYHTSILGYPLFSISTPSPPSST